MTETHHRPRVESDWLSTTEVALALGGISDDTVRRFIADGHLRATAIVVGGRRRVILRIHHDDLEAFRKAHVRDTTTDDWER